MKKIICLLLIFTSCLCSQRKNNISSAIIEKKIKIEDNNIEISLWSIDNKTIRISARNKKVKYTPLPFIIDKPANLIAPERYQNGFVLGKYYIVPENTGFTVYTNKIKLYSSKFFLKRNRLYEEKTCFNNESFFGMGQISNKLALANIQHLIRHHPVYGHQTFTYIPFYFSSGGDSFYYNSQSNDKISFGDLHSAETTYSSTAQTLDYYYSYRNSYKKIISNFYKFSKSTSLLPKWAYGFIQSKYGYENQSELFQIVDKFKHFNIPLSAIVLDLYWFKHMGDLDWDRDNWSPKQIRKKLDKHNLKLITITEPFITENSKNYKFFDKNNLLAKDDSGKTVTWDEWWCFNKSDFGSIINPIALNAKKIIGSAYIKMIDSGIDGFWTDLGEPENTPTHAYFNNIKKEDFHNHFNYQWLKLVYNAVNEKHPNKRLFFLSRSGYTGLTRFNASIWSGDVPANFNGLKNQVALGLNSGLSGFPYWGSDVGGFIAKGPGSIPNKELFVRWYQFGTFNPIFRAHGHGPREPWIFGEKTLNILKYYINLRYTLLPYIYSTAYQSYAHGFPMMRPLFFDTPLSGKIDVNEKQFYFGDSLLVVPVLSSITSSEKLKFNLPGGKWIDIHTGKPYSSGSYSIKKEINHIPVFIKEGAIIPMLKENQNIILLFPSEKESKFTWYNDDGISNKYKKGIFEAINISMTKKKVVFSNTIKKHEIILKVSNHSNVELKSAPFKSDKNYKFYRQTLKKGETIIYFK